MSVPIASETDTVFDENPGHVSDELLVSAARSGDSLAFVELSKRYSRKLLRRSFRITRNWQDAEDVVQDSLLSAFVHLKDFQSRCTFSSWITQIVINTSLMILRKKRVRSYIALDGMTDHSGIGRPWGSRNIAESPEGWVALREREQLLTAAILRLPVTFREIIQLRQAKDCSIQELAQDLGISVPAVKSRLSRARRALRASLGNELGNRMVLDIVDRSNDRGYGRGRFLSPDASWNAGEFIQ